ncbi:CHAT domain-containing tetratricopeptide repeat protein [uncultured Psychroserpens sp.]|uniref:CHAT domain-containing protein n=1 Tax=uncultured Psychroserpens sp. TaxID=255436 RepID=UPI00260918E2|nr:CHAT domain-containing tetratricopeptide repeat protein [uncultured Psychroserpens sp.]
MKNSILIGLFLISSIRIFSQDISQTFKDISSSKVDKLEKEQKFDSLLNAHKKNENLDLLFLETYELAKWYRKQGNLPKAIELNKKNLHQMDSVNYAKATLYRRNLYSLGFYERKTYDLENALKTYNRLLQYETPDKYAIQGAFQMAEIYFTIGQYHNSKDHYELSKTIAKRLNFNDYYVRSAIGIGQACKRINTPNSLKYGVDVLSSATEFVNITNTDEESSNDVSKKYIHTLYNQLGNIYIDRFDYDFSNGKINLDKALSIAMELENDYLLGKTYNDIGVLYLKSESEDAEFYFNKALSYYLDTATEVMIHRNLSIHYLFFENYSKALTNAQTAISKLVDLDTSNIKDLPTKQDLSNSKMKFQLIAGLSDKANVWLKLAKKESSKTDYLKEALKTLELAHYLVEQARLESQEYKSKLFWRKTATEIYMSAVKASYLSKDYERAFYFIEKNKSFLLLEDVMLKVSRNNSNISKKIINQEMAFKNEIAKLEELSVSKKTDSVQSLLLLTKNDYNEFINSLDSETKFYFKTHKAANVINLEVFKSEYIDDNNAYLEYILDDEEGYGLLISKTDTKLFKIEDFDVLKDLAVTYRSLIETPFDNQEAIDSFKTVSHTIYSTLFPKEIHPFIIDKKLTIVPDYYLQNIPFESLLTSTDKNSYLIFQNEINYAYSLTFLSENDKINRANKYNLTGFAPVEFTSNLSTLSYSEEELKSIDRIISSKLYLRKNALKETFLNKNHNSKIIHIASHANANDSISPWISFYDSKVDLNDLYHLNNTPDLVVLSACNTSLGELYKGEGVMSLSRGFFNTGSHSVLPTLWEVNDKASTQLLNSFYENLKEGQNKSLALHNAKLKYLENNSLSQASPYYWSSFILIGDAGDIEFNNGLDTMYYFIFAIISLIIITLFFRRKKSTTN